MRCKFELGQFKIVDRQGHPRVVRITRIIWSENGLEYEVEDYTSIDRHYRVAEEELCPVPDELLILSQEAEDAHREYRRAEGRMFRADAAVRDAMKKALSEV